MRCFSRCLILLTLPLASVPLASVPLAGVPSASAALGQEYQVHPLKSAAPADELPAAIAQSLASEGVRVTRGASAAYCDIWLAKQLTTVAGFTATPEVAYPFKPGSLVGVAKFSRKSSDFRDQDIEPGVYTLRYGQQPVDGAHVGTSPTRDFLALIAAQGDESAGEIDLDALNEKSAQAAGSNHPALLCLQRAAANRPLPAIRHDEEREWWIVAIQGQSATGQAVPLELVVVGQAAE